jgi:hypothetical protein
MVPEPSEKASEVHCSEDEMEDAVSSASPLPSDCDAAATVGGFEPAEHVAPPATSPLSLLLLSVNSLDDVLDTSFCAALSNALL